MTTKKRSSTAAPKRKAAATPTRSAAPSQEVAVTQVISPALQELIGRAITDAEFRKALFADRAKATKGFKLTSIDQKALAKLTPDQIEKQATVFAKKLEIYVFVQITIHF